MTSKIKKWEDSQREDLQNIPTMEAIGYKAEFSYHDKRENRITPSNVPHLAVNFVKGDKHVWSIREGWQTADLINSHFTNHKPYNLPLTEIIEKHLK